MLLAHERGLAGAERRPGFGIRYRNDGARRWTNRRTAGRTPGRPRSRRRSLWSPTTLRTEVGTHDHVVPKLVREATGGLPGRLRRASCEGRGHPHRRRSAAGDVRLPRARHSARAHITPELSLVDGGRRPGLDEGRRAHVRNERERRCVPSRPGGRCSRHSRRKRQSNAGTAARAGSGVQARCVPRALPIDGSSASQQAPSSRAGAAECPAPHQTVAALRRAWPQEGSYPGNDWLGVLGGSWVRTMS